jgi:hypothetical protein
MIGAPFGVIRSREATQTCRAGAKAARSMSPGAQDWSRQSKTAGRWHDPSRVFRNAARPALQFRRRVAPFANEEML